MSEERLRLAIIIGSTREKRFGDTVADWFIDRVRRRAEMEIDVIDLAKTPLPTTLVREPTSEVKAFAKRIDAADAFIVITPEFNHGYPASLKLAIDLVKEEWRAKPVGFVSYGGISGGLRAVEQLRQVFAELHVVSVRETVSFHRARTEFDEAGRPKDPDGVNAAATALLDQLVWWALALRDARRKRPYAA